MSVLNISPEDVLARLQAQYKNIFSPAAIQTHFEHHVQNTVACGHLDFVFLYGRPSRLLDIGCGYGSFVILARRKEIDAWGIELEPFEVQYAQQRLEAEGYGAQDSQKFIRQGSAYTLPFETESFDAITLWDVLEHVENFEAAISEATRVLKVGGRIFISCPNYFAFRNEAHYQVPWLPLLPKPIAATYLRLLGRDPGFLLQSIFYRTNRQILSSLKKRGFKVLDHRQEKLQHPELIQQAPLRSVMTVARKIGLSSFVSKVLSLSLNNPLRKATVVCAIKQAAS